jgi:hypothetical protein
MARLLEKPGWRPAPGTMVGGALFILGLALTGISWKFLYLSALGTFGPGILRELGLLRDQDEFQRRAARRAGYHSFLVTGLVVFLMTGFDRDGGALGEPGPICSMILSLLWFTWLFSSLLAYWGPRKTAKRILIGFGVVWIIFIILSTTGPEYNGTASILIHALLAAPFFILAYFAGRWPKISGVFLLGASVFFVYFFRLYEIFGDKPLSRGRGEVIILFLGPLLASGIALLTARNGENENIPVADSSV